MDDLDEPRSYTELAVEELKEIATSRENQITFLVGFMVAALLFNFGPL